MAQRCGDCPSRRREIKREIRSEDDRAHARLSPSSSHRWLRCPGSVNFLAEYGEDEGGEHADRGTILHKIAEECLAEERDPYEYVGEKWSYGCIVDMEITDEHADAIVDGLDLIDSFPGKLYTEYQNE